MSMSKEARYGLKQGARDENKWKKECGVVCSVRTEYQTWRIYSLRRCPCERCECHTLPRSLAEVYEGTVTLKSSQDDQDGNWDWLSTVSYPLRPVQHSLSIATESCGYIDTMADAEHAPAMAPPVRTDERSYHAFDGVLSIELTSTMLKECCKNLLNPSTLSQRTKGIGTNITWGRRKLLFILIRVSDSTKLIHISPANGCTTFHPRTESPLSFAYEENCIVISSYVAKGCNEKFFGMTIPNELINDVIRGADYYDAYLEKVAKHQREDKRSRCRHAVRQVSPLAKRAKAGKVVKKRTVKSSKQLVDEFIDEGVPGKGKEKVGEKQAAQVLLHLQTTKKKSPTEQYIFQRHTPVPSEPAGHEESSSLYAELGLSGSDTESDEEMPSVVRSGAQDEGQARPNPDNVVESQPLPTPSVLVGPNLEHSDVEITDASNQTQPEHMDEGFIATAYPKVQENLNLTVDEQMILEEPVSSTRTLSFL
ncbi:hypothetical protein Tco_0414974 [Tanacetum coccineum]